jgi:PAS domain S-box-containing protein
VNRNNHCCVLIIEDSLTQVALMTMHLAEIGMRSVAAHTLEDGLERIRKERFDALLLDLTLPDSSGLGTVTRVAQEQPMLPIVVMTALEGEEIGFQALQAGAEDFLMKGDVEPVDLKRSLRYAIERKRQSNLVYESANLLRQTIENSYNAFLSLDERLRILEWNSKAEELFGYAPTEVVGKNIVDIIFPAGSSVVSSELFRYFQRLPTQLVGQRAELTARHRGGREFPVETAFFAVRMGERDSLCSFVSDITDRKAFEKHTSEFYSMVAHELRAPLTSIKGSISLILGDLVTKEEHDEFLTVCLNSCDRLIILINDLLQLSKFEAGKMPLKKTRCDIVDLVARTLSECRGQISANSLTISEKLEPASLSVDSDRIIQVLINLLSNASKYSPKNGTVRIDGQILGSRYRISISDEGPGIPEVMLHKVFQKFQQLQDSESIQKEGTGLGLAISKAIINHHSGDIGVTSEPGCGTTFWFELPLGMSPSGEVEKKLDKMVSMGE